VFTKRGREREEEGMRVSERKRGGESKKERERKNE
jgi:hypothetical protein